MALATDSWRRSIAYLRTVVPDDDPAPVVQVSGEDEPVLRDLGNGLLVAYLIDAGETFEYLQLRHLDAAGVTADTVHRTALDNLYALAEQHLRVQPFEGIYAVFMEGNFEASAILLDTLWDHSFCSYVHGGFLAAIPSRDVLAFGDAASPRARHQLGAVVQRCLAGTPDHPMSSSLYRRVGSSWTPEDA